MENSEYEMDQPKTGEEAVEEIAETLNVSVPKDTRIPLELRLIAGLTLIGGLSIIGSLFVDIIQPSKSVATSFYILRLMIGSVAIAAAYGIIKRERWALWLYGLMVFIGLVLNAITALIPGIMLIYLFMKRHTFKKSVFDRILAELLHSVKPVDKAQ